MRRCLRAKMRRSYLGGDEEIISGAPSEMRCPIPNGAWWDPPWSLVLVMELEAAAASSTAERRRGLRRTEWCIGNICRGAHTVVSLLAWTRQDRCTRDALAS